MKRSKSKHLSYYDLLDSLKEPECPVCRLTNKAVEDYYDSLIYEYINDRGFRDRFRKDKGFCQYHAYKFLTYNDGLAVSLPYRDLLSDFLTVLKSENFMKKSKNFSDITNLNDECMVCRMEKDVESMYLSMILDYIEDEEFVSTFVESEGLCIQHYIQLSFMTKHLPKWFKNFHIQKYERMLSDLDRYIDSCNYSLKDRRPVLTREEKLIYKKIVRYIYKYKQ